MHSGQVADWELWSFKFVTWMSTQYPGAKLIRENVAAYGNTVGLAEIGMIEAEFPNTRVHDFHMHF